MARVRTATLAVLLIWGCEASRFKADMATICGASSRPEFARGSMAELAPWLSPNLHSERARDMFRNLASTSDVKSFPETLRTEARGVGIASCPFADALDAQLKK